jgi:hypothetical protein
MSRSTLFSESPLGSYADISLGENNANAAYDVQAYLELQRRYELLEKENVELRKRDKILLPREPKNSITVMDIILFMILNIVLLIRLHFIQSFISSKCFISSKIRSWMK